MLGGGSEGGYEDEDEDERKRSQFHTVFFGVFDRLVESLETGRAVV